MHPPHSSVLVLGDVPNCNVYFNDVVIFSNDWKDHMASLKMVFLRLAGASLTLNLAKCEFGKATVTYLGKQVGLGQVRPVDAKITAILSYPVPSTRRELRRFLGMTGVSARTSRWWWLHSLRYAARLFLLSGVMGVSRRLMPVRHCFVMLLF